MQFEILVEDASGKIMLESIVPRIIGPKGRPHKYRIINIQELKHRTMARMPRHLAKTLPWDDILFETLRRQLKGYGLSLRHGKGAVVIVVDADWHDPVAFREQLERLAEPLDPKPQVLVRLAVEEGEAWLLGDPEAIVEAFPFAKRYVLEQYEQDSECGTWEWLADAIYKGGSDRLTAVGYPEIGRVKCLWAKQITPFLDLEANRSPSFQAFYQGLRELVEVDKPLAEDVHVSKR